MRKTTKTVFTCPDSRDEAIAKIKEEYYKKHFDRMEAECAEILLSVGVDKDVAFETERVPGEGIYWTAIIDEDDFPDGFAHVAIAELDTDTQPGKMSDFAFTPCDLAGVISVLDRKCSIRANLRSEARRCVERKSNLLKSVPEALRKEPDLHEFMKMGSGPMPLRGPRNTDEIDEVIAEVHAKAPWLRQATLRIWKSMRAKMNNSDQAGLQMSPILLHGPPGTGKTRLAAFIAEASGAAHMEIDATSSPTGFALTGVESGWSSRNIGEPLRLMIESQCPNPVVVVNEIDKVGAGLTSTKGVSLSLTSSLLPLLDVESSKSFRCPMTSLVCDMSGISWLLTANDINSVPAPLRTRCEVIEVPALTLGDFIEAAEVMVPDDPLLRETVIRFVQSSYRTPNFSLRHIARAVERLSSDPPALHLN